MIDPNDLPETVTRRRPAGTTQSRRGKVLAAGFAAQSIRCLIQPHRGNLKYEVEGVLQDVTEALYCNFRQNSGTPTDIQELDTVIRAGGQQRRVVYVADEGGQCDHLKVYLVAVTSARTATDGSSVAGGGGASSLPAGAPAPPAARAMQAEMNTLAQQIADLTSQQTGNFAALQGEMEMHLATAQKYADFGSIITASMTITKPAVNTSYRIDTTTAPVVITLYASTGDETDLEFERIAGTNNVTFVLNSTAPDTCPLGLANTTLANIGETQNFREQPGHIMEAH